MWRPFTDFRGSCGGAWGDVTAFQASGELPGRQLMWYCNGGTATPKKQIVGASPLDETGQASARLAEPHHHGVDGARRRTCSQQRYQLFASGPIALGEHRYPAVSEVAGMPDQAEFQGPGARPPAEADALHPPVHPGVEPHRVAQPANIAEPANIAHAATRRGGRWQFGQKYDERFIHFIRAIGLPHRAHGSPKRP